MSSPAPASDRPDVAIAHDYLTQRGGAERVVLAMAAAFPAAPIVTSVHEASATYPAYRNSTIRTSPLQRVPVFRHRHRLALPVLPLTFGRMTVDAGVTICSSSGWAHGVRATGRKVVYCYTPARWLYPDDETRYFTRRIDPARVPLALLRRPLEAWDRAAAGTADRYLAISTAVAHRIGRVYGIEAEVLHPPLTLEAGGRTEPVPELEPGYDLCVSRLLPYKNVGAVIDAYRGSATSLVVVGRGPESARLRRTAGPNVRFLEDVSDGQLRWIYASARFLVHASYEDYGLTPLEAAAHGVPAVVLRTGGFLDTVVEGVTGGFFDRPTPDAIRTAVDAAAQRRWDRAAIRAQAAAFSAERFVHRLREIVGEESDKLPGRSRQ